MVNQTFPDNVKARARTGCPISNLGADEHTILIGHSSGAVAAMRYAETHRLLGSILVGVCHTDLGDSGEAASGYYREPWQWDRIRDAPAVDRDLSLDGRPAHPGGRAAVRRGAVEVPATSSSRIAVTSLTGMRCPRPCCCVTCGR